MLWMLLVLIKMSGTPTRKSTCNNTTAPNECTDLVNEDDTNRATNTSSVQFSGTTPTKPGCKRPLSLIADSSLPVAYSPQTLSTKLSMVAAVKTVCTNEGINLINEE